MTCEYVCTRCTALDEHGCRDLACTCECDKGCDYQEPHKHGFACDKACECEGR